MNASTHSRIAILIGLAACGLATPMAATPPAAGDSTMQKAPAAAAPAASEVEQKLARYFPFKLTTDLKVLTTQERAMLPLLIEAAEAMDAVFWQQAYGDREQLLAGLQGPVRRYAEINYGPWDRLDGDAPFVPGVGAKPPGANFYPPGVSGEQIEAANDPALKDPYTVVRKGADGKLQAVPYHRAYADHFELAAAKLRAAAALAEDAGLRRYLELRAKALLSGEYRESDLAWMEMKGNGLDIVIGPIENYEDKLLGAKTAAEAYVLVKDRAWSQRLQRYAALLPELQQGLPVPAAYKQEKPGTDADLGAYDVVFYAGDCNAGGKTIAINLPNDEEVQLQKGTRRLQLKNAMRAKFDAIMTPIADLLLPTDQRELVTFDAFFANTMFHEVAHGLGIKQTIDGKTTVREALGPDYSALEEGKADVLGLYMVHSLVAKGEQELGSLEANDVTFVAGIFRSIRFGASSAHGVANLIRFNYFAEKGAFQRGPKGHYRIDFEKLRAASSSLSEIILRLQGDGDKAAVKAFVEKYGKIGATLAEDLQRINDAGIPVDVVFEQGIATLGL
jgi:hypothetical protein